MANEKIEYTDCEECKGTGTSRDGTVCGCPYCEGEG